MRMLDSFWAYTRGRDNRFPKVIIASTTFIKETSANVCQDISDFFSGLFVGKPYEYLLRGEACLISQYLKHDQTKDLKRLTKELLQNISPEASISDQIIEKFEYLRKTGKKVLVQIPFDSANSSLDVGDEGLSYLHATRLIFSAHGKSPKWVILDPEFLVSLFQKIVEHDCKARQVNQDIETGQIRFYRETDLKKVIGSENGDVILEAMLDVGLLAKAMKNARPDNMFALINNGEVPDKLQSLRYLPDQKECPHFHSPILCIKFKDACIVESAFRLIKCRLLRTYPYETQGKRIFLYRDFAAFKVSEDNQEKQRLSLLYINEYIFVFILAYTTRPGSIEPKLCVEIRKILEDAILEGFEADQNIEPDASNSLLVTEKRTIEYEYLIRCPDTTDKKLDDEGLVSVADLFREISTINGESASYTCSNHSDKPQPHNVDTVSLVKPWFPEKLKDHAGVDVTSTPTLTPAINDHRCFIKLDQILVAKIAKCIGQGWQLLAYELGIDKPTLDKIIEDNPRNTEKAMTDMLMKCVQDKKGRFTLQDVRKCIEATNVTVNWDAFNKLYEYEVNRTSMADCLPKNQDKKLRKAYNM